MAVLQCEDNGGVAGHDGDSNDLHSDCLLSNWPLERCQAFLHLLPDFVVVGAGFDLAGLHCELDVYE